MVQRHENLVVEHTVSRIPALRRQEYREIMRAQMSDDSRPALFERPDPNQHYLDYINSRGELNRSTVRLDIVAVIPPQISFPTL